MSVLPAQRGFLDDELFQLILAAVTQRGKLWATFSS
jgi:hypothetical protein